MSKIFTIGHSTRPIEEFVNLLKINKITLLADVRTIPKSLHNPQFQQEELEKSLNEEGIDYKHFKDLGGLRPNVKNLINLGWKNQSFRNYADYMQTNNFKLALAELIKDSNNSTIAIMCAEAVPWRCHRRLIADALVIRNHHVLDIISATSVKEHVLTEFAHVDGEDITYQ